MSYFIFGCRQKAYDSPKLAYLRITMLDCTWNKMSDPYSHDS